MDRVSLRPLSSFTLLLLFTTGVAGAGVQAQAPDAVTPRRAFAQPSLSPDGAEVAFVSGGDIWAVPANGGVARLLVSHEATESRPLYSPDGQRLAFVSDRAGSDDLYILELATGDVRRLTWSDAAESLDAWSRDGRWLFFTTTAGDIGGMTDVQKVPVSGGTPVVVSGDRSMPEYFAAPSPDGSAIAMSARARMGFSQWWRNGHSHIDEAELWVLRPDASTYTRVSEPGTKNLWPLWVDGGSALVFLSDRGGAENLWIQPLETGVARALTTFTQGRVLWPSLGNGDATVVFERDFGIWRFDLAPGSEPRPLQITLRGAAQGPTIEHLTLTSGFSDLALSPDGRKVAFIARGEVFAAAAGDVDAPAQRVTSTPAPEAEVTWAPDSRRVAYTSRRSGTPRVYLYDFVTGEERPIGSGDDAHATPRFSPDGNRLAYVRAGGELIVTDLDNGRERVIATGHLWTAPFTAARPLAWSPDGRWLAFFATDGRMFTNVHVVAADGSAPARPVSQLANSFAGSLAWAPDGTALYFDTQQRTESGQIARVDLVARTPEFVESRWRALFEDEPFEDDSSNELSGRGRADSGAPMQSDTAAVTVVVDIDFDGVHRRLELLPLGVDAGSLTLSRDGKTVVFQASAQGQTNLYSYALDPLADERPVAKQLTSTSGDKGLPYFTADGKTIVYLDRGRIRSVGVDGQNAKAIEVTAVLDVDFDREKLVVFDQGWSYMRDQFYDAAMHGVDWRDVRERFAPYVEGAETRSELERLMNLMVGELNASHLGHSEPNTRSAETGRIGVNLEPAALEGGVHRIASLVELGPAQIGGVQAGEYVLAVDGQPLGSGTSLDRLLDRRVGDRVELRVAASADGRNARTVVVKPVSTSVETGLRYRAWVEHNRAYVHEASDGRLGYVHMADMGWPSMQQLIVDLDAENFARDGVVIDLRGNRGGFVNAYALDVFARRGYITMEVRGFPVAPARSMLGQRSLEAPTALVIDLNSLSDAEDFTEGYRALGMGPVIGEPTAGWIIYTWGTQLVDGSSFRMPRSRIRSATGDDMELHPRPVDVHVVRPLGEGLSGGDRQLDAAVRALLGG